jgi:hypothetical protein
MEQVSNIRKRRIEESISSKDDYIIEQIFDDIKSAFLKGYPDGDEIETNTNVTLALIGNHPTNVFEHRDEYNCYLLHYACQYNQSLSVVTQIYDLYKSAIQKKDNRGFYPIHYACQSNQSESVVLKLIDEFPNAVKRKECFLVFIHFIMLANSAHVTLLCSN